MTDAAASLSEGMYAVPRPNASTKEVTVSDVGIVMYIAVGFIDLKAIFSHDQNAGPYDPEHALSQCTQMLRFT